MEEARVTVPALARRKARGEKVAMITAYDHAFARIFDSAGVDVLLVGDSLGNVVQGRDAEAAATLKRHASELAEAGAAMLVLELMPSALASACAADCW